ncbi:PDZ domain-containing protein [Pseudalkalibacillus berkeleyi]|uniref:PDZ domain-containing protein n=1 Tax=Pseudalkalibacillus berkeleyi TaxID=1069813 RepID=A0ABS9H463_9BACL|nr:PDZ domain-containing protein [Pseudalkalibacillus berkeleyi]MCF6138719.1 PDZ domain-containing protein [Pseudalkalibacillus berkeleyi]
MQEILWSFIKGMSWFFLNPLFYVILILIGIHAVTRVKRERSDFHVRIHDTLDDFSKGIFPGLLIGFIFSLLSVFAGLYLPFGVIAVMSAFYILLGLTLRKNLFHPVFAGLLTYVVAAYVPEFSTGVGLIDTWMGELQTASLGMIALLVAALVVVEGILIMSVGAQNTSPILLRGKRGKGIGAHVISRIWLVPLFVLVPGGAISTSSWFPMLQMGEVSVGIALVPFAIGFHHVVSQSMPEPVVKSIGSRFMWLGVILLAASILLISLDFESLSIVVVALAFVGRNALILFYRKLEVEKAPYFSELKEGLRVLGIIPGSPASKMNVSIGERIVKVNGRTLDRVEDFYGAVQSNAQFCKMEVLNENGDVRFVQRSLYENEHHELGLLFAQPEKAKRRKVVG